MCTGLLDIQEKLHAVKRPQSVDDLHPTVPVIVKNGLVRQCRGSIHAPSILQHFSVALVEFFVVSYLSTLPPRPKNLDHTKVKQTFENQR